MSSLAAAARTAGDSRPNRAGASLPSRLLGLAERSHATACALLLLIGLACFLPGFVSLQPMDRDEPRFAQATKQMLETGDFIDIRFQDEARHKKPVGIHWMQSAAVTAAETLGLPEARTTIAVYRLPSLLGALATILLTYWAALAFVGRRGAFLAAALVGASVILTIEAHLAKTDAMLAACSVAVMGALARAYLARGVARLPASTVAMAWGGLALGILIKGPMVLLFAGLCALVLSVRERSGRWLLPLRPWLGLAVVLLVVAPWFIAIAVKSGGAFYTAAVGDDLLGKVTTGQQKHWGPPGYYTLAFFGTFWPAAALTAIAIPFIWSNRRDDGLAFTLAWAVPSWLLFEAFSTKLPHYVLPLYPAIAIATVIALDRGAVGPGRRGATAVAFLIPFIPIGLTVALLAGLWTLDRDVPWPALPVLAAAIVTSLVAWRSFARGEVEGTALAGVGAAILIAVGVLGLVQPELRSLKISERLAAARAAVCPGGPVGTLGYREPSLVFLAGTDLDMVSTGQEAAAFLAPGGCRVMFVERRFEEDFRREAEAGKIGVSLVERVAGFNINGGRRVDLGVYRAAP